MTEIWHKKRRAFDGRLFNVESGEVTLEDGTPAQRDVVVHPGGVAVVAEVGGNILFGRQFRIAIEQAIIELPAGTLEPGDTPAGRAAAELREETGYAAGSVALLTSFYVSPGYTTERIDLFHATDLREVGRELEADERIELVRIPRETAKQMLREGAFVDAKTIIGLHCFFARP